MASTNLRENCDNTEASSSSEFALLPKLPPIPERKPNQLVQLLTMFPDKMCNWSRLSNNPNITMEYIAEHPVAWVWANVCDNPNLTMNFFLDTLFPKLEAEVKESALPRSRNSRVVEVSYWKKLSLNPGLKYAEICAHYASCSLEERTRYKWNWHAMCSRGDVTIEMLLSPAKYPWSFVQWDSQSASGNPNLTTDVVLKSPELWDWKAVGWNSSVAPTKELINHLSYVRANGHTRASVHPLLSFQLVLDHYCNTNNNNDVVDYEDGKWSWESLSTNLGVTIEMILAHPESQCAWDWVKFRAIQISLSLIYNCNPHQKWDHCLVRKVESRGTRSGFQQTPTSPPTSSSTPGWRLTRSKGFLCTNFCVVIPT